MAPMLKRRESVLSGIVLPNSGGSALHMMQAGVLWCPGRRRGIWIGAVLLPRYSIGAGSRWPLNLHERRTRTPAMRGIRELCQQPASGSCQEQYPMPASRGPREDGVFRGGGCGSTCGLGWRTRPGTKEYRSRGARHSPDRAQEMKPRSAMLGDKAPEVRVHSTGPVLASGRIRPGRAGFPTIVPRLTIVRESESDSFRDAGRTRRQNPGADDRHAAARSYGQFDGPSGRGC
jgi:hypothetical protein